MPTITADLSSGERFARSLNPVIPSEVESYATDDSASRGTCFLFDLPQTVQGILGCRRV